MLYLDRFESLCTLPICEKFDIRIDMLGRRYTPPSSSALVAFECAARHLNFSRAADELNTSQSAISRHIAGLEDRMGVRLFIRRKKGLRLTDQGDQFYRAVVSSLETIQTVERSITSQGDKDQLTIACTHSISHLFIMPRFDALQTAMGPDIEVRILTTEYDQQPFLTDDDVDIRFVFGDGQGVARGLRRVFSEMVVPVCSRMFLERHHDILQQPVSEWAGMTFLDISKQNLGWTTWSEVASAIGMRPPDPQTLRSYTNYVYLLEAAASGQGLALGWAGLADRYIGSGALKMVPAFVHRTDHGLFAAITRRENKRSLCERALAVLGREDPEVALMANVEEMRNPVEQVL